METKFTKGKAISFLKESGKMIGDLTLDFYYKNLTYAEEQAFADALEIGIEHTIAALYDANVEDLEILRVVKEHWGIDIKEAENRLVWEKQQATIRALKQYLKLQGYSKPEIDSFMRKKRAAILIGHDANLWKMKNNPKQLFNIIESNC